MKLIDVMRADTRNRFIIKGDGNALRAKINSGGQAGRVSLSSMSMMSIQDELGQDFTQVQTFLKHIIALVFILPSLILFT